MIRATTGRDVGRPAGTSIAPAPGPWNLEATDVARLLGTDLAVGLGSDHAAARAMEHGPNELVEKPPKSAWRMLLGQLEKLFHRRRSPVPQG